MEADFLILADRAEAINGKLYMVGGGFDRVSLAGAVGPVDIDVAFGILVDYLETNQRHGFRLVLENEDNQEVLPPIAAEFEVGRPPGLVAGQAQRVIYVVRGPFPIPRVGGYHWVLYLDGARQRTARFWVQEIQVPLPPANTPQ
jgi:hypothetical protein